MEHNPSKLAHQRPYLPFVVEEIKWRKPSNPLGVPVWSHEGIICTGETYKDKVKLTFAKGASLEDQAGLVGRSKRAVAARISDGFKCRSTVALAAPALTTLCAHG